MLIAIASVHAKVTLWYKPVQYSIMMLYIYIYIYMYSKQVNKHPWCVLLGVPPPGFFPLVYIHVHEEVLKLKTEKLWNI